jgi:hypothetical protein
MIVIKRRRTDPITKRLAARGNMAVNTVFVATDGVGDGDDGSANDDGNFHIVKTRWSMFSVPFEEGSSEQSASTTDNETPMPPRAAPPVLTLAARTLLDEQLPDYDYSVDPKSNGQPLYGVLPPAVAASCTGGAGAAPAVTTIRQVYGATYGGDDELTSTMSVGQVLGREERPYEHTQPNRQDYASVITTANADLYGVNPVVAAPAPATEPALAPHKYVNSTADNAAAVAHHTYADPAALAPNPAAGGAPPQAPEYVNTSGVGGGRGAVQPPPTEPEQPLYGVNPDLAPAGGDGSGSNTRRAMREANDGNSDRTNAGAPPSAASSRVKPYVNQALVNRVVTNQQVQARAPATPEYMNSDVAAPSGPPTPTNLPNFGAAAVATEEPIYGLVPAKDEANVDSLSMLKNQQLVEARAAVNFGLPNLNREEAARLLVANGGGAGLFVVRMKPGTTPAISVLTAGAGAAAAGVEHFKLSIEIRLSPVGGLPQTLYVTSSGEKFLSLPELLQHFRENVLPQTNPPTRLTACLPEFAARTHAVQDMYGAI